MDDQKNLRRFRNETPEYEVIGPQTGVKGFFGPFKISNFFL